MDTQRTTNTNGLKAMVGWRAEGKGLSREALAIASQMAEALPQLLREWEALSLRELASKRDEVFACSDQLDVSFIWDRQNAFPEASELEELMAQWEVCLWSIEDDGWPRLCALVNKLVSWEMAQGITSDEGAERANARWDRLEKVKEWAFEQRALNPAPRSRASLIREIEPELVRRAKDADEPLTGSLESRLGTIARWFRVAGIK